MKLDIIAGARPNFMKIGPLIHAINAYNANAVNAIEYRLIHTGQHYDKAMSESFFEQLNIPQPHLNLGAGGGTQAEQTAAIMVGYERALQASKPAICIVVGDVTSTLACAIVAKKAWVKVAHIEGGIRSGDETMPEEINRMVTDCISDYFFTTTALAEENLLKLGHSREKIHFVGNTMIDSLLANLQRLQKPQIFDAHGLSAKSYLVMTLHRPSNVDDPENLRTLLDLVSQYSGGKRILFPMHPRTRKVYDQLNLQLDALLIVDPMDYLSFIYVVKHALGVITDSGGITEETTVLGIPCMTLRESTERPETVTMGTNELVGTDPKDIIPYLNQLTSGNWKSGSIPPLWDGKTSERIVQILASLPSA